MEDLEVIDMRVEEIEAIRIVDLETKDLTTGAEMMEVSRRTFTRDLKEGRRKMAEALIKGKAIQISGGDYRIIQEEKK